MYDVLPFCCFSLSPGAGFRFDKVNAAHCRPTLDMVNWFLGKYRPELVEVEGGFNGFFWSLT